jgi:putative polyketide hydroxylase
MLDLLQRDWVLLTEDERWCDAAVLAGEQLGLRLERLQVGGAIENVGARTDAEAFQRDFRHAFGLGPEGASLVRPDGYVAWRSIGLPTNPAAAVVAALSHAACPARQAR